MSAPADVLEVARHEIGYVEERGNHTKYGVWFGMDGQPWCAMFVSWVAARADATDIIPKHAYTPSGAAWFAAKGEWGAAPRVGAVAYYDFSGLHRVSHVGLVESVHADGSWVSIEGNTDVAGGRTGGRVMRQTRRRVGGKGGFGYPAYDGTLPTPVVATGVGTGPSGSPLLLEDGDLGPVSIVRLQESLNRTGANPALAQDGELGPGSKGALQTRLDVTNPPVGVDGSIGPQTVRALQANVGATIDGEWGAGTTLALQRTLNVREL